MGRFAALLQEYADRAPDPEGRPWSIFFAIHEDTQRRRAR